MATVATVSTRERDPDISAISLHGRHPQFLIEKIVRIKIYELAYWKEKCFALNAESLVDRAVELKYIGGCYGGTRQPSPFLALLLKMLQIAPELDIVLALIDAEEFKYMRMLGAVYLRLTASNVDIYTYLEPLLNDYRKIVTRTDNGDFVLSTIDSVVENLLRSEFFFNISLPRLQVRHVLEDTGKLLPRYSLLNEDPELNLNEEDDEDAEFEEVENDALVEEQSRADNKDT